MKIIRTLFVLATGALAVGCTYKDTYVHTHPRPRVYSNPNTIAGDSVRLRDPGEPSQFRAATGNGE